MSIPSIVYKAHATGNDFVVYLDEDGMHEPTADEVRFLCDRHFGIGGDGLIRLAHPQAVSDVNERQIADCAAGDAYGGGIMDIHVRYRLKFFVIGV